MSRDAGAEAPSRNPFHAPRFLQWWLACMLGGTGAGIQTVTVPLFIRDRVDLDVRGLAIAGALVAQTLPAALLVLFGGTAADRVERWRILTRTYSLAASVASVYVLLTALDVRVVWPVYLLAAVIGSSNAFASPARQSLLPQLVTREQLQNGVILGTMAFMATFQFLGPSLGGVLVDARGMTEAFAVEVVLLGLAAAVFSRVRAPTEPAERGGVLDELLDGLRYVRGHPAILGLLGMGTVIGVCFIGPFSVSIPILVPDVFGASDKWVGLLWGFFGGGVFAGSLALTRWRLPRRGLAASATLLIGGVVYVLYGLNQTLYVAAALSVVSGLNASVFMNYVAVLIQEGTEPRMMGRVMSMYTLAFFASMPVGYAQAGLVVDAFGPQATLVSSGVLAALVGLGCVLFLGPVRRLE